jgi:hypothetical protein
VCTGRRGRRSDSPASELPRAPRGYGYTVIAWRTVRSPRSTVSSSPRRRVPPTTSRAGCRSSTRFRPSTRCVGATGPASRRSLPSTAATRVLGGAPVSQGFSRSAMRVPSR